MFTEDLSAFFSVAEHASPATLNGVAVQGIFENAYTALEFGGAASSPVFTLPTASVPTPVVGLSLAVGGKVYQVVETMPDGTGITMLRLRS